MMINKSHPSNDKWRQFGFSLGMTPSSLVELPGIPNCVVPSRRLPVNAINKVIKGHEIGRAHSAGGVNLPVGKGDGRCTPSGMAKLAACSARCTANFTAAPAEDKEDIM
jgi:hypothetical protein